MKYELDADWKVQIFLKRINIGPYLVKVGGGLDSTMTLEKFDDGVMSVIYNIVIFLIYSQF